MQSTDSFVSITGTRVLTMDRIIPDWRIIFLITGLRKLEAIVGSKPRMRESLMRRSPRRSEYREDTPRIDLL